jgi:hypothetical protein
MKPKKYQLHELFFLLAYKTIYMARPMCETHLVCHVEISQTMTMFAVLLVSFDSPWWVGVHQAGFIMFWGIYGKVIE